MDTDASAKQYQSTVKRLDQYCPDLVSLDKGSLVRSGGSYTIGPEACAPRSLHTMGLCVGAPRKELTQAYQGYSAALQSLQSMPQLVQTQSEAQVCLLVLVRHACLFTVLPHFERAWLVLVQVLVLLHLMTSGIMDILAGLLIN